METLRRLAILLCTVGLGIASYLIYVKFTGGTIACSVSSCGIVNSSEYANFIDVPVPVWGLAFYLSTLLVVLAREYRLFLLFGIGGALFSGYLTYLEAYVIKAWCEWCILSAWISLGLLLISIRLYFKSARTAVVNE